MERRLIAALILISVVCEFGRTQKPDECETSSEKNESHERELERDNRILPRAFILCFVSVRDLRRQAHSIESIRMIHKTVLLLAVVES